MAINNFGYVRVFATDMDAWREYGTKVLGFVVGKGDDPDALYFRMDDHPHRWIIVPGEEDKLSAVGWECANEAEFEDVKRRLDGAGVPWQEAPDEVRLTPTEFDLLVTLATAPRTVLTREREAEQQIYDNLITKLKEGNLLQDFEGKQFEVIQPPTPAAAVAPDKQKILLASTLGGFALGVGIVILLGLIDPTIRTVSDLETFTELPVIGVFPRWKSDQRKADKAERQTIASSLEDTPENASSMEAVRTLRAGLTFLGDREERCTFAITSAIAAEGKSWVASNLALSFAKQGDRTLLIDADLRRPVQARIFGYDADSPGLTDHLSGNAELKSAIRRSEVSDQLYLLGAGSRSANPAELLAGNFVTFSEEFSSILHRQMHVTTNQT